MTLATKKPIMVSGIQPSNKITIGNYFGAIKPFVDNIDKYNMYVFIADLHAITNTFNPTQLAINRKNVACMYYACGLDFNKVKIFYQSAVKSHTELAHVLLCHTTIGELSRMTQFKDKSKKASQNGTQFIPTGLLEYPVLMAADILLYDAQYVIVGQDQKQHIELCRNIAQRINNKYGKLFVIPKPLIFQTGTRIMDIQDPSIKMSKSNKNENGTIFVLDDAKTITEKIKKAKTDSLNKIKYDKQHQPAVANLIEIYSAASNLKISDIEKKYCNINNYGIFKKDLANLLINKLLIIQKKYTYALKIYDKKLLPILNMNANLCTKIVQNKTNKVYSKMGLF